MNNDYIKRIKEVYPDLTIDEIYPNEQGQNNDVVIVNHSLVFRFPKYNEGIENLKTETKILEFIKEYVSTPIPIPIYQVFHPMEPGQVFTGYQLIHGTPLWRKDFIALSGDEQLQNRLATQLVSFLIELHSIPKEKVKGVLKLKDEQVYDVVSELFFRIKGKLFAYMRDDAKKEVSQLFNNFLNDMLNFKFQSCLIHGDFGASNILFDREKKGISGIIDFGGSGLGDPSYDFASILASYGESFYTKCIELYPNGEQVAKRVRFYKQTFALQEALHGVENNDPKAFENGIKAYR